MSIIIASDLHHDHRKPSQLLLHEHLGSLRLDNPHTTGTTSPDPRAVMAVSTMSALDFSGGHVAADDQMPSPPASASSATPPASIITAGGGPLMGTHSVLPRPRPGRKPAADAPRTKRGEAGTRAAQRSCRAREGQSQGRSSCASGTR